MSTLLNYEDTIDYLFTQLPMFQRSGPKVLKYDLSNIAKLMDCLENPQESLTCIHIAGTNGKGSVSHMITSILQEAGLKVGLYTSPHYKDYRERIRVNGTKIEEKSVIQFVNHLRESSKFKDIDPTFFEITVAMAFDYFKVEDVDICVIETGLGGRLDSTNIITPILSIITNIGYDHQAILGETLSQIAGEKAGIIKPNVPVLIGQRQDEVWSIFADKASECGTTIHEAKSIRAGSDLLSQSQYLEIDNHLSVPYLKTNARTAIASIYLVRQIYNQITGDHIYRGLHRLYEHTEFMGRWQRLSLTPMVIADAAHNLEGITQLTQHLNSLSYDELHIVLGMVGDKPLDQVLPLLPSHAIYYFAKADIPRGKPAKDLQQEAKLYRLEGKCYTSVRKALTSAKQSASKNALVLVTGSIFTVAEVI